MPVDILGQVLDVDTWQPLSSCADPKLAAGANWFPAQHHARDAATEQAYRVCAACPVRIQCLAYALLQDRNRDRSIFGGVSPRRRSRLKRILAEAGLPIALRVCTHCGRRFSTTITYPRERVCCSDTCRAARRRTLSQGQEGRRSRRLHGVAALAVGVDNALGPAGAVPPAFHVTA
ncbi:MAG: WhiB family transcriptional regulator [Acidobacteriota bacterium]|nr:WhiB family transcriptional regulator [Acidobacteriota bacterium]